MLGSFSRLREILVALLRDRDLLHALAVVRGHGGLEDRRSPPAPVRGTWWRSGRAACRSGSERWRCPSACRRTSTCRRSWCRRAVRCISTLLGSLKPKSKSFLLRKSSRPLSSAVAQVAGDLVDRRRPRNSWRSSSCPCPCGPRASALPLESVTVADRHLCPDANSPRLLRVRRPSSRGPSWRPSACGSGPPPGAVGAQRLRLQDLPFVLVVLAELDGLPLACSSTRVSLSESKVSSRLSRRSSGRLVESRFHEAGDGEDPRVALQLGVRARPVGVSSPISSLSVLPSFLVTVTSSVGRSGRTAQVGGLLLDQLVGVQRGQRRDHRR